jgi:hypothetical protein
MHLTDTHLHIGIFLTAFISGGGLVRVAIYVSKNLAPLPKDAGWWATTFYNLVKGASGLDPNSSVIPQHAMQVLKDTGVLPAIK